MGTLERSTLFRRDYKRAAKGPYRVALDDDLVPVLVALQRTNLLPRVTATMR